MPPTSDDSHWASGTENKVSPALKSLAATRSVAPEEEAGDETTSILPAWLLTHCLRGPPGCVTDVVADAMIRTRMRLRPSR